MDTTTSTDRRRIMVIEDDPDLRGTLVQLLRDEQLTADGHESGELALAGHNAVMPTIERTSDVPYRYRIGTAPLAKVANVEKFMPRNFITKDGFGITDKCKRYLAPLIRGEDYPTYARDGLPKYVTLKNVAVKKRLPPFALK